MKRHNFDTIICLKNYDLIQSLFGDNFIVQEFSDIEGQVNKARGCVIINSFDNLDFKNLLTANIDVSAKLYGFNSCVIDIGQERIYPSAQPDECGDFMIFSNCYIIPSSCDSMISSLDQIKSSLVTGFHAHPFKLDDYRPALFLDRDGIINVDYGYVHSCEKMEFMEGVIELLSRAQSRNLLKLVVTNQAGVARGYYDEAQVDIFHNHMSSLLKERGIEIDAYERAVHHFSKGQGIYKKHSFLRKPHPGMILKHLYNFPINLSVSVMIGDRESDVLNLSQVKYILLNGRYKIDDIPNHVKLFNSLKEIKDYLISLDFL